ncbi:GNAT family N-acetyltransferase [Roseomonas sp. SSH11]|uniref:GNAT family N-acetyltransferase n=1 Tax=Pararoseomonas baculiformis TaxID=2820812 RepID=A0ABS4AHK1_9PROT|nr:GNAT family protein [Pararoseomonas baculiformis]MBP0446496.1 GNAT family N-acetyltransferase [Pararoseomonas baculiformis]
MAPRLTLRRAGAEDIRFVMAVEATPGHDAFINQQAEAEHAAQLASPAFAYFIAEAEAAPVGFAILSELTDRRGNHCLKRIAVAQPGRGFGTPLFNAVTDWTFANTAAHRFWLHALASNGRALHVYQREGFTIEGRLRQARPRPDGSREDLIILSLLRPEWQALRRRAA